MVSYLKGCNPVGTCAEQCGVNPDFVYGNGFVLPGGIGSISVYGTDILSVSKDFSGTDFQREHLGDHLYDSYVDRGYELYPRYIENREPIPWTNIKLRHNANPWDDFWDMVKYPNLVEYNGLQTLPLKFRFEIFDEDYLTYSNRGFGDVEFFETRELALDYSENNPRDIYWEIETFAYCHNRDQMEDDLVNVANMTWAVSLCENVIDERTDKRFPLTDGGKGEHPYGTFYINDEYMEWNGDTWRILNPDYAVDDPEQNPYCRTEIQAPYIVQQDGDTSINFLGGSLYGTRGFRVYFDPNKYEPQWAFHDNNDGRSIYYMWTIKRVHPQLGGLDFDIVLETPLGIVGADNWIENINDDGTGTSSIRPFGIYNLDHCLAHPEGEYTVHRLKIIPKAGATSTDIFSVEVTCSINNWGGDPRLAYTVMNYENLQDTDLDTTQEFVLQTNKFNSFEFISESDYG